jgi:outer membrane protein assembly factor BamB
MNARAFVTAGCCLAAIVAASCSTRNEASPMGPSTVSDASVARFHADANDTWPEFRLGGGLNVVADSRALPREVSWRFNAGSQGISSSPVVYRDLVLVASNDRYLYAIEAATGRMRWRYLATDELMTQPVYAGGVAVVGAGNQECIACLPPDYVVGGSGHNRMSGVALSTGRERWGQEIAGTGMPSPALIGNDVVHADGSGTVLALDVRTGKYKWNARLPSTFAMSSVVNGHDGRVYVSGVFRAGVYALRASDGTELWRHMFSKYYQGTGDGPMASTGTLVFGEYLQPTAPGKLGWVVFEGSPVIHHVFALEKRSGHLVWDRPIVKGISPAYNQSAIPLVYRGRLFEGSPAAPFVTALSVQTGGILWQRRVQGIVRGGIAALDGVLYLGDRGGYLWAIDANTGRVIGRLHTDVKFNVGSPIILNDSLIDGSLEGIVIAVPLQKIRSARD